MSWFSKFFKHLGSNPLAALEVVSMLESGRVAGTVTVGGQDYNVAAGKTVNEGAPGYQPTGDRVLDLIGEYLPVLTQVESVLHKQGGDASVSVNGTHYGVSLTPVPSPAAQPAQTAAPPAPPPTDEANEPETTPGPPDSEGA